MISAEKAKAISETAKDKGYDQAAVEHGISKESVRRYVRSAKNEKGEKVDSEPISALLKKLTQEYSEAEIKALLYDKKKHHDTHKKTEHNFTGEWIKFGVMSDLHIGSNATNESEIEYALDECKKASCEMILLPGDVTEGMSGRDGHVYELEHIGYKAQRDAAISILSKYDGKIKAISGNHDLWYASKANIGALIVEDICNALSNAEYLGEHEGSVYFNGARVDLWHGEDGASYALSYRIQKIVESIEGGSKPNMIIAGHDHKAGYLPNLRNIQAIMAGCIQHQTPWMRRKKLAAYCGFWIVELCIRDKQIIKARPEWIPFYN